MVEYTGHTPDGEFIRLSYEELDLEHTRIKNSLIEAARQAGDMAIFRLVFTVRGQRGVMLVSLSKTLRDDPDVDLSELFVSEIVTAAKLRAEAP